MRRAARGGHVIWRAGLSLGLSAAGLAWGQAVPERPRPTLALDARHFLSDAALRLYGQIQGGTIPPLQTAPRHAHRSPVRTAENGNVLVNDPSLDTPEFTTQSETTLAVHGSTICAGYNDTGAGPFPSSLSGFSRSGDLGATWSDQGVTAPQLHLGDPALAVHQASGTFYYAQLALAGGSDPTLNAVSIIAVSRSTDDCRSFLPDTANASPTAARASICAAPARRECSFCRRNSDCDTRPEAGDGVCMGADFEDKPWIAVDNSGGPRDGSVYVCWSRFVDALPGNTTKGELRFSRSTDAGRSFADDQALSVPSDGFPFGCHIAIGADGEVYVAWSDRSADFPIRFRRSLDGGVTWDAPVQVNTVPIRHPGTDRVVACGSTTICGTPVSIERPTLNGDVRMASQAWMAVDTAGGPFTGNIYVAWAHDPPGLIDNSDIFLSRSADGGLTWSLELQVAGGTPTDEFEPFVIVGGMGTLSIAWYDRRNDLTNNTAIDVYTTFSRDGGATVDAPTRLTDVTFAVPPLTGQATRSGNFDPAASSCYMGEYIAGTADTENFYYAWGDNRNTVVSFSYPGGRPDADVYFARRQATAVTVCAGDCNGDTAVTIDELLRMVNIGLGDAPFTECTFGDADNDGQITIADIVAAVNSALSGCAA